MSAPNPDATHYSVKYAFITLIALSVVCQILGLAGVPGRAALFVFSFFALRDLSVAPALAPLLPRRLPVVQWHQIWTGIAHSAIAGGLSALLVIAQFHYEVDHKLRIRGQPRSHPPDYRGLATSVSEVCAVVQLLANVVHVLRAGPAAPDTYEQSQQATFSRTDTDRRVIRRLTGVAYLGFIIYGFVDGTPAGGIVAGLPVFVFFPLFFFLRDSVIGASLPPRRHAVSRWTDRVFESTLAGAAVGFLQALAIAVFHAKMRPADAQSKPINFSVYATGVGQMAMLAQIVGNVWNRAKRP